MSETIRTKQLTEALKIFSDGAEQTGDMIEENLQRRNRELMLLNRAMARTVKEAFDYEAGKDPETQPPLRTFKLDDDNSFIL